MNLPRRALLAGIALAGLMPGLHGRPGRATGGAPERAALLTGLAKRKDAATVGRAYLAQRRYHGSAVDLSTELMQRLGIGSRASQIDWNRRINRQCRHEFAAGDAVDVDGWLLARTEAGLCALTALFEATPAGARQPA